MSVDDRPILLDTHTWLWLCFGTPDVFTPQVRKRLSAADAARPLHVSIMSIWEVAMLASKGRVNLAIPTHTWVARAFSHPAMKQIALEEPTVVIESNELPGDFHADPAGRLLVATARIGGYILARRDRKILDYAPAREDTLQRGGVARP